MKAKRLRKKHTSTAQPKLLVDYNNTGKAYLTWMPKKEGRCEGDGDATTREPLSLWDQYRGDETNGRTQQSTPTVVNLRPDAGN